MVDVDVDAHAASTQASLSSLSSLAAGPSSFSPDITTSSFSSSTTSFSSSSSSIITACHDGTGWFGCARPSLSVAFHSAAHPSAHPSAGPSATALSNHSYSYLRQTLPTMSQFFSFLFVMLPAGLYRLITFTTITLPTTLFTVFSMSLTFTMNFTTL